MQPGPQGLIGLGQPAALRPYTPSKGVVDAWGTLFRDDFAGAVAAVDGRVPPIGPTWAVQGAAAAGLVAGAGEMSCTSPAGAAYGILALAEQPGEIGCRFVYDAPAVTVTFSGTAAPGDYVVVKITPSRAASAIQVVVYMGSGGTAAEAAASLVSWITEWNSDLVAAGITASRSGAVVTISSVECPAVDAAGSGGGLAAAASISPHLTMACWPSGQSSLDGMMHYQMLPNGVLAWDFYVGGIVALGTVLRRTIGLSAAALYTVRACIDPPYTWGGIWAPDGTLRSAFVGQDTNVATRSGRSIFYETTAASGLSVRSAWAYRRPSVPRAAIEAALA